MKLEDVRKEIDALDPQIKTLILRRMDCSLEVAKAKQEKNTKAGSLHGNKPHVSIWPAL